MFFYFGAGIFLILAIISFFGSGKKHKLIKKKIEMLERDGLFEEIFTDFSSSNRMFSKKLKLAMAPHFILDFSAPNTGFNVIPLQNVNNVFKCNMLNGRPTVTNYIAIENTDGNRYVFAPSDKITPEFESVIGQLKNMINGGAL